MSPLSHQLVAEVSLAGMGFDALGGCYLAYDLLGGKRGPLGAIARTAGFTALFLVGYLVVLGLKYAVVAAGGMGLLLAIEFRPSVSGPGHEQIRAARSLLFGFLRGLVLGLAGMTLAGPLFGAIFGVLSGLGLMGVYSLGFSPRREQERPGRPHLSRQKILASLMRALAVSLAGLVAAFVVPSSENWVWFGLRLGLAAGTVSALVSLYSPTIEWWVDNLPERRLGVIGLCLVFFGMLLQSFPTWMTALNIAVQ
ncbi:MAG TPA: hypothetical protein VK914_04915 [bacterium]|jgi:hypothetical protein|nr:hypothetical protein [bacterium]